MNDNVPTHAEKINIDQLLKRQLPLAPRTTFHSGGNAEYAAFPSNYSDLLALLSWAQEQHLPVTFLGGGSNTLVSDQGIPGLTLFTSAFTGFHFNGELFCVRSGMLLDRAIDLAIEAGLSGLELLGGIPGTVGGAIYGNAGALTTVISDTLYFVDYLTTDGKLHRLQTHADEFTYRHSPFMDIPNCCICEASFRLRPTRQTAQLRLVKERAKAGKVAKGNFNAPSAGCFFKNPEGTSAGLLIDQAGMKGKRVGGAMVSMEHANFIINTGSATSSDILALSEQIVQAVQEKSGITLQKEVRLVGAW